MYQNALADPVHLVLMCFLTYLFILNATIIQGRKLFAEIRYVNFHIKFSENGMSTLYPLRNNTDI